MNNIFFYETEIGIIGIRENNKSITDIFFSKVDTNDNIEETDLIKECFKQLKEYLEGNRRKFDLPLEARGTEFQKKVWNELLKIPYGETKSYKDIAIAIGNEKACRAIGMANNKNHIPIIIPCHRVIGSNGKLVGYAGGLNVKEKLLNIENLDVK
ncbi:methylated-DNA--[protein]-cysteine S-methyltransferase [Terrisporobacter vanillatitrophus]|uniref:methylated-DNA--[protein]-cysteine S-methyltransferase n=1 Tax=Terrisporobacter vanillatitrophus TaxID=3058402 RepID=UPI00336820B3